MNDLPQMMPEPLEKDPWVYRLVVGGLVVVAAGSTIGGLVLAGMGVEVPVSVVALGSAAIAGMVGLLAPSPR